MKDELFNKLIASLREGGAILRGEKNPARSFKFTVLNVKHIRARSPFRKSKIQNRKSKLVNC